METHSFFSSFFSLPLHYSIPCALLPDIACLSCKESWWWFQIVRLTFSRVVAIYLSCLFIWKVVFHSFPSFHSQSLYLYNLACSQEKPFIPSQDIYIVKENQLMSKWILSKGNWYNSVHSPWTRRDYISCKHLHSQYNYHNSHCISNTQFEL